MSVKPQALSEQIRRAIRGSGWMAQEVADRANIHKSALSRFLSGERGLSVEAMDRIGLLLGLDISTRNRRTKRRKN